MALLAARWLAYGSTTYRFLLWNLFLAWVPVALALLLAKLHKDSWPGRRTLAGGGGLAGVFSQRPVPLHGSCCTCNTARRCRTGTTCCC